MSVLIFVEFYVAVGVISTLVYGAYVICYMSLNGHEDINQNRNFSEKEQKTHNKPNIIYDLKNMKTA